MTMFVRLFACWCSLATLTSGVAPAAAQADAVTPALIQKTVQANMQEFFDMLALLNDSVNAEDIRKNADWLVAAFRKRGSATKQLENDGKPLVFAEYVRQARGARTVLFYMHFDGMPVIPAQWAQQSPWVATLKHRNAGGQWEEIDRGKLKGGEIDPNWRLFARSASDDKGPIMMFLNAFDTLKAAGLEPVINVRVLLDSEEEKGSPTIGTVATTNRELLRADGIVINDGPMHETSQPTIVFGNRGNTLVVLTVYGPKVNLHSGHYGNYAPNPAQRLAALLASMKDDSGRVTVKGYYEGVKLTDAERKVMAEVPDDEAAILKRLGISKPEAVGRNYQEALQFPSLNIRGMAAAAVGEKAANILPSHAVAEIDLRTTPGADPAYLTAAIENHIRAQGYFLAKGEPTDEERTRYDKIASLIPARGSKAAFTPIDSELGAWAQSALAKTFASGGVDARTVRIRMMGGSVPTDKLVDALAVPFVIVPMVNNDNNQHSFDENLRIGHLLNGTRAFTGLLRTPY
jgi:acetylornithine deacetylase/succinyl-diaminopimelate desuccinylase-like protein